MTDLRKFCKTLEASIDIIALAGFLGIKFNRNSMAPCIKHSPDKKASMLGKNEHCYCFSCSYYARAIKLTMDYKGVDFKEAINIICDFQGIPKFEFSKQSQEEIEAYQKKRDREDQFHKLMDEVVRIYQTNNHSYLVEREISQEIITEFQIGATNGHKSFMKDELLKRGFKKEEFSPLLLNQYGQDFFQDCVIVPIFKSGVCIGLYGRKYDNSQDYKHLYLKADGFKDLDIEQDTTLYNWDNARKFKEIYIFESIIDCLTAISCGIPNSVAIYGTQGLKKEHIKQLETAKPEKVYLVMDGDLPGRKAAMKNGFLIEESGIEVKAMLIPNEQDPNEYFLNGGTKDTFLNLPQYTSLQMAIRELDPNLKGNQFLKAIEPLLEKIAEKDPLIWKDELKEVRDYFLAKPSISELKAKVKQIAKNKESLPEISLEQIMREKCTLAEIFQDESSKDMIVPEGWALFEHGISQIKMQITGEPAFIHVSHFPIILTETAKDIDEGIEYLTLKYKKEGRIFTIYADRKTISEQKSITILSEKGFPVNSVNAKQIIRYLEDFEAANIQYLKKVSITHGFGHKEDTKGKSIFYLPQKAYNTNESIIFQGKGPGDNDFARALETQGTLNDWIEIIKQYCVPYNRVMFAIYTGFAAILLKLFGCTQSFVLHSYANRSCGKTTLSQVIASIYGNPGRLLFQWKHITEVAAEQLAGLFNGIPIFLEDSQNADEKKISEMIYMIANGVGKARGYKTGGLQKTLYWITMAFSTGEKDFFELVKKGGAEARSINFQGSPFGSENDAKMGDNMRKLKMLVHKNYGTAIYAFLDYIYSLPKEKLKSYYDDAYKFISYHVSNAGEIHRHIEYFACILTAGLLAEEVFHFGSNPMEICKTVLKIFEEEGITDLIHEGIEETISWMNSNDNLYDISGTNYEEIEGNYGQRHGVKKPGEYIAVFPHLLKEFLVKQGYSPSMVLKGWKDRGWIEAGKDKKRTTVMVSFRNKPVRMVKIYWKIINQL